MRFTSHFVRKLRERNECRFNIVATSNVNKAVRVEIIEVASCTTFEVLRE